MAAVSAAGSDSTAPRPSALVDYLVVFVKEEQHDVRLCRRYPEEDALGAALPLTELLPHAADAQNLDPAVSFTVSDSQGNLFFCTRVVIRPEPQRDFEYVLMSVSRRCRFKLFQDVLIGIKTLLLSGDCVEAQLEQLLLEVPLGAEDRLVRCVWEGVGELTVHPSLLKCGLPELEDHAMNLLLDALPADTLLNCMEALLKEENVIVVSNRSHLLAPAIESLRALLHPFVWSGLCMHLVPRDSVSRALTRKGLPWLYGIAQQSLASTKELTQRLHHQETPRCLVVSLDEGKAEWLGPTPTQSSPGLWVEFRRLVVEKYKLAGPQRIDGVRVAFLQGYLDMLHGYKPHVNSWSTSSQSKREAGFDCEAFLSQSKLEFFDLLKSLLSTRMFADFVFRVVNSSAYMSSTFDKLCKAWPQPELPHAARELLMRRYGYTERGARLVWARVKHLQGDPNLFSSKKFRDFVSELGLSKEGPPSTGDAAQDEIADRHLRIEALVQRPSETSLGPPLLLTTVPRRPKQLGENFPPQALYSTSFNQRLAPWIPRRDEPVLFTRPSARATYFAFCRHPSDDELLSWRSHNLLRPRLHLAFVGGSSELKSALASSSASSCQSSAASSSSSSSSSNASIPQENLKSSNFPKPVVSLTCAMKWAQLQGKRSLYDANQMIFQLLMEERLRHRDDMRRLREKRSSSSSAVASTLGTQSHQQQQQQYAGEASSMSEVEALEMRVREMEEKLRQSESTVDALNKQLRESAFPGSVVRKSEPLYSPRGNEPNRPLSPSLASPKGGDRPASPGAMSAASSQSGSVFTSPSVTPRKISGPPLQEVSMGFAASNQNGAMRHSTSTGELSQALPYTSSNSQMGPALTLNNTGHVRVISPPPTTPFKTAPQGLRMASPPPASSGKSFFSVSSGGHPAAPGMGSANYPGPDHLKRSVSFNDVNSSARPDNRANAASPAQPPGTLGDGRVLVSPMAGGGGSDGRMFSPDLNPMRTMQTMSSPDGRGAGPPPTMDGGYPQQQQQVPSTLLRRSSTDGLAPQDGNRRGSVSSEIMSYEANANWLPGPPGTGQSDANRMGSPHLLMSAHSPPPVTSRKPLNVMTPSAVHASAMMPRPPSMGSLSPAEHQQTADVARRERNQRVLDTIESGFLRRKDSSQDSSSEV